MNENFLAVLFVLTIFSPVIYQFTIVIREHKKERQLAVKRLKRLTKISLLSFIPVVIITAILSHTNYLDYEQPITYDKFNDISFENFRGIELFKKTLHGSEKFAYVVTSIDLDIDSDQVTIQSLFYPSRSYVYDKYTNSKELLTHEKYHIKITELFARKAREKVAKMDSLNKKEIKQIVTKVKSEEREYQRKYDYDTYHSYIFHQQKKYEREVDSLLSLLTDYKNPIITFNEKD